MRLTIIYTFRNRDLKRVKKSLDSLDLQVLKNFKVIFIDYGSFSYEAKHIVEKYEWATYYYASTKFQPWNKCKALNFAIKNITTEYCFNADIDMIFHPEFTLVLESKMEENKVVYFKVGFLSEEETLKSKAFEDYQIKFETGKEATGMTLFPVSKLKQVRGFDEFFHFWGSEDTDVHNRLSYIGCTVEFYDSRILLLHQWHKNYRARESKNIVKELQLTGIVELNSVHLKYNLEQKITQVNSFEWGNPLQKEEEKELFSFAKTKLTNEKKIIDHFVYKILPNDSNKIISVSIQVDAFQKSLKYKLKKQLGKKVPIYYTMKQINDLLLMHIISFYHHKPYIYYLDKDLKTINFSIKK